jgi:DUF1009 family protein
MPKQASPIGLLAGAGRFPISFARKARDLGLPVVCVGLRGEASPELAGLVDSFHWASRARLGQMIRLFKREGVERIVMAGKVHKANMLYKPWKWLTLVPDLRTLRWWYFRQRRDNKDHTLLRSIIDEFARDGLRFESALELCPELLVKPGVLTRREPTAGEEADIRFGWSLAKRLSELEVGQSVAVKERSVLAVEAVEGTDAAITRAGALCRAGDFVVVKVARPGHDMRFDVPTVGTATVETLHRARGRVLAVEAGKTIILDQAETIALANAYQISVVAWEGPGAEAGAAPGE